MGDENSISEDEKIKIAANFLFHSPPGEFKEVFLGWNIYSNKKNPYLELVLSILYFKLIHQEMKKLVVVHFL